jgi:hypothetical protein
MKDYWRDYRTCGELSLALGVGCGLRRLMRLGFYGTCIGFGLFALPLSGAGLTFFAAAKKVSKESSLQTPALTSVHSHLERSGSTGGVSLAGFHRCWHVEKARTSHRYREWNSSHTSVLALRARRQVC